MFTRSDKGSKQGQIADLDNPVLPAPVWVEEIRQEMRALGDLMRLREALAVANRDIERYRIERDKLIRTIQAERSKVMELEVVIADMMRRKT